MDKDDSESEYEVQRNFKDEEWDLNFSQHAASLEEIESRIRNMSLKEEA